MTNILLNDIIIFTLEGGYMHLYEQDKAIEFNGLYKDIERMLTNLEKIGIDISEEKKEAVNIKEESEKKLTLGAVQMQAEIQYSEGIKKLKELSQKLERHKVYYYLYNETLKIETELAKKEISNEQIKIYASTAINLLKQIQSSDTRVYNSEKMIVEKVYLLAYNIIQFEIIANSKSILLEWVKSNNTASSYINNLIFQDLILLEPKITNDIIKEALNGIITSEINSSYLNESLILFIAMQKNSSLEYIENILLTIIKDITESEELMKKCRKENNDLIYKISELKKTIKKSHIYKELGLTVSLIAFLAGLKYGGEKAVKLIGHNEYKTNVEYFSTEDYAKAPVYPEYMPKISNFEETILTAYDVWRQEKIFYGEYQREITTYNLSNIDLDALEDYLDYDFSELSAQKSITEKAEELDVNELYDKAIVEITRLTQDESTKTFVPNEELQDVVLIVLSIIGASLTGIEGYFILKSIIKKLKDNHNTVILEKEKVHEYTVGLENYKKLSAENEEFKKRFIEMYQKFSQFIENKNIKEEYKRILKES